MRADAEDGSGAHATIPRQRAALFSPLDNFFRLGNPHAPRPQHVCLAVSSDMRCREMPDSEPTGASSQPINSTLADVRTHHGPDALRTLNLRASTTTYRARHRRARGSVRSGGCSLCRYAERPKASLSPSPIDKHPACRRLRHFSHRTPTQNSGTERLGEPSPLDGLKVAYPPQTRPAAPETRRRLAVDNTMTGARKPVALRIWRRLRVLAAPRMPLCRRPGDANPAEWRGIQVPVRRGRSPGIRVDGHRLPPCLRPVSEF